jgi:ABC-type transport system involved in cytochrome c biogenesis permease subunit
MNAGVALIVYLIILIVVFLLARYSGIKVFSSLALGVLIAVIIMAIIYKPTDAYNNATDGDKLYGAIILISIIFLGIYILVVALKDTETGTMPWTNLTKPAVVVPANGGTYTPIPVSP